MNMNKTTIVAIAAVVILLSVTCVGVTYSWFSAEEKTDVSFEPASMTVEVKDNKYVIWSDYDTSERNITSNDGKIAVKDILLQPGATYYVQYTVDYNTNVSSASVRTEATITDVLVKITTIKYGEDEMNGWLELESGQKSFTVTVSFTIDGEGWTSEDAKLAKPVLSITNKITQTAAVTGGA